MRPDGGEVEGPAQFASPACLLGEFDEFGFTVRDALIMAARHIPGETPRLEAEALLSNILSRPRAWLMAHPESALTTEQTTQFDSGVAQLAAGVPLAYLTGRREFFGLAFFVNRQVLVPRPETELLVETALAAARLRTATSDSSSAGQRLRIADIGTGSGCIAVALAVNLPEARVIATDISTQALAVARRNAEQHDVEDRIEFRQGDLLTPITEAIDVLCTNLPYIDTDELATLEVGRAKAEPALALDGGPGGLRLIGRLLGDAPRILAPGGLALLEIGATQAESASALAGAAFPQAAVNVKADLAGLPRLLVIEVPV